MNNNNSISDDNKVFWDELCGSVLAKSLGITDHSISSIEKFDNAYLEFYPYLIDYISPNRMKDKKVLEIGLGYGTVGRNIAMQGASYVGFDIAESPVKMLNQSFGVLNIEGKAMQGDFLRNTFASNEFDYVVSIGCFHHTGDIQKCIDETYRILKPDGEAIIMLYNQFSWRQWVRWPWATLSALFRKGPDSNVSQRKAYDANLDGSAAPETEFTSIKSVNEIFEKFSKVKVKKENFDDIRLFKYVLLRRESALKNCCANLRS